MKVEKPSIPSCGKCVTRVDEPNELRAILVATEDENEYLGHLSWISAKEPQIGMPGHLLSENSAK